MAEVENGVAKRRMASIQIVRGITPIPGADKILKATVLGWETVIKLNEFKEGDLCVWHEPDTIVDQTNPVYEIIKKHKYRLKISKIRGQISQGLALPLHHFESQLVGLEIQVGLDVTDQIKILHYTKPTNTQGDILHSWPAFLRKTDQPNLRSNPQALEELRAAESLVFTLKMDGTSATYFFHDGKFGLCSRNFRLEPDPAQTVISSYRQIATKYALDERMTKYGRSIALQGEVCGPGINNNPASLKEVAFYVFHAWDTEKQAFLDFDDMVNVVKEINALTLEQEGVPQLQHVPILERGPLGNRTLPELIAFANKLEYSRGKLAEGMVICTATETYSPDLDNRLSVKVLSEQFELKHSS